jgi:Spy/CpxP family protein refolding chaperone
MLKTLRPALIVAVLLAASVCPAFAQPARSPFGPQPAPFAWWKNEQFKKELGLTADQATRIDKIWETTLPELRQ